ncbi:Gaa1-domain-containing protein [Calocera viscosa TUFC12733]|uniref:Gaa1-domain-containing protein n=1 Tax=Calocera viscosa (strain TUFC12733) TaxID=1330018 RepID=A0A167NGV4_CALVF|nr:Gaa1-domain-containing protein [Calocera viscosa TUFC12733]
MSPFLRVKQLFKPSPGNEKHVVRLQRQKRIYATIGSISPYLQIACYVVGILWIFAIPFAQLGRSTYVDENALQPGQVSTYWEWAEVHAADRYLEALEVLRDGNASSQERAGWLKEKFADLGIPTDTQGYTFKTSVGEVHGVNAYAFHSSPRTSGAEAIVIAASWTSLTGDPNLRGVAMVLALAGFLTRYTHWAKDLVFVVSDGYQDGMQAFLSTYHGFNPNSLTADPLTLDSGVIWTAVSIDYPGHSFSHLGLFFEGLNGRLPNQDLLVCAQIIGRWTGGVPVILHNTVDELRQDLRIPAWAQWTGAAGEWVWKEIVNRRALKEWEYRAQNMAEQAAWMATGRASGVHGVFHQFRIDAITLFARPALGPHGFHSLGKLTESLLRTMNNLLERLHASFFFYLLSSPASFLKIGSYLPCSVLIGIGCLIGGLRGYVNLGWEGWYSEKLDDTKWIKRPRRLIEGVGVVVALVSVGAVVYAFADSTLYAPPFAAKSARPLMPVILTLVLVPPFIVLSRPDSPTAAPLAPMVKTCLLFSLALLITPLSVLNFPLSLVLAVLAIPLSLVKPSSGMLPFMALGLLNPALFLLVQSGRDAIREGVWDWQVLGAYGLPLACLLWLPLIWVGQAVCLIQE